MNQRFFTRGVAAFLTLMLSLIGCGQSSPSSAQRPASQANPAAPEPAVSVPAPTNRLLVLDLGSGVKMKLALIPAGEFQMGSPLGEAGRDEDERQHTVKLTAPFFIGTTEVTQEQYEAVTGTNPSHFKGPRNPVEQVSWNDATEFCRKLSEKTGRTARLPTEAEWEYACRAGTTTAYAWGNEFRWGVCNVENDVGSSNDGNVAYFKKAGLPTGSTVPVGSFPANAWGLYDMHGNVGEWCQDGYGDYPAGTVTDPTGSASGSWRVFRGSFWDSTPELCRSATRFSEVSDSGGDISGLRVVVPASAGLD